MWELSDTSHDVIAVLCSDIHLCHKKPIARSPEVDWYGAMARSLEQLMEVVEALAVPLVIAGDVFDRWNAPAELINFAMHHFGGVSLPVFAIPGQHDLPNHNYDDIKRSAYWTLVEAGKLINLAPGVRLEYGRVMLYGFPWGAEIKPPEKIPGTTQLAVCHSFIYNARTGYRGAPKDQIVASYRSKLKGYDAAVFGDNHKGFLTQTGSNDGLANLLNCGTFMRRKADEINYSPSIGLLHEGGAITRILLDVSSDQFIQMEEAMELVESAIDLTDFAGALVSLGQDGLSFVDNVKRFLDRNGISDAVRQRVMEAVSSGEDNL